MTPSEMAEALEEVITQTQDEGGGVMAICYFWVPPLLRGRGVGRAAFEALVQQMGPHITRLELVATDEERQGRHSEGFWRALGFVPKYQQQTGGEELDILDCDVRRYTLWRGVNGHATLSPVPYQPRTRRPPISLSAVPRLECSRG